VPYTYGSETPCEKMTYDKLSSDMASIQVLPFHVDGHLALMAPGMYCDSQLCGLGKAQLVGNSARKLGGSSTMAPKSDRVI